ncbi:prepilin-type N-terminal cleavage/methylation domain-containing protein [Clostridium estertheticum]|uniref:PilW family protein n=1 Tax=Clostridium estertheticum TaxID=238834 RepID=UPI001C7DDF92|nr:type II secretion system protein [Clostridium estertheticum]MBX4258762.1 prepilin-type N-terminal cleavage/methylation domain-containing protein [Clostridium estertheticum]WLC69227.1 prepilin-type N-terminal cleavage/methylation domain-containing protein [Clostridium estertheticum]
MIKNKVKKGFSLIEIIVAIAILGIVMVMVGNYFTSTLKTNSHEQTINELQLDGRKVLNSITQDIRSASIILPAKSGCIMSLKNGTQTIDYKHDSGTYTLFRAGIVISRNIKSIIITPKDTTNNIYNINITTQKKNTSETYNIVSSVSKNNVAVTIIMPDPPIENKSYDDLTNFEKNMFSIVGPNAGINFGTNNVFNPYNNNNNGNPSILMQGTDLTLNGLGNNINANIAIKADTLNLGSGQTGTSTGETVLDVKKLTGSLASYNSTFYVYHDIFASKPNNANNWNPIEMYKGTFWSYLFEKQGEGSTIPMTVRLLTNNIDFTDKSINPALDISNIHYFRGISTNKITDNKLPNYNGIVSTVANVNNGNYEYIICHGPLLINTTDPNNGSFDFKGIIYCDDVVTFNDMSSKFDGIIISKGFKAVNVIGSQNHNWNVSYNNNANNLTGFNQIIRKVTGGS